MRLPTCIALLTGALVLGACQTDGDQAELSPQPQGVEGLWNSVGGPVPYTARFQSGQFTSIATGSNAPLARGSYSNSGNGQVSLSFTSNTTQQRVAANCNQVGDQMTCTSSNGSSFSLSRA